MYIRFLDGPRKGQVCDVLPSAAQRLCKTGMAEDVRNVVESQGVDDVTAIPPALNPVKKKAKTRKKKAKAKRRS